MNSRTSPTARSTTPWTRSAKRRPPKRQCREDECRQDHRERQGSRLPFYQPSHSLPPVATRAGRDLDLAIPEPSERLQDIGNWFSRPRADGSELDGRRLKRVIDPSATGAYGRVAELVTHWLQEPARSQDHESSILSPTREASPAGLLFCRTIIRSGVRCGNRDPRTPRPKSDAASVSHPTDQWTHTFHPSAKRKDRRKTHRIKKRNGPSSPKTLRRTPPIRRRR